MSHVQQRELRHAVEICGKAARELIPLQLEVHQAAAKYCCEDASARKLPRQLRR